MKHDNSMENISSFMQGVIAKKNMDTFAPIGLVRQGQGDLR